MRATYFSSKGAVRMVYLNVSSILQHDTNSIVTVCREVKATFDARTGFCNSYTREYPLAHINLAPGEYVETSEDAERS